MARFPYRVMKIGHLFHTLFRMDTQADGTTHGHKYVMIRLKF